MILSDFDIALTWSGRNFTATVASEKRRGHAAHAKRSGRFASLLKVKLTASSQEELSLNYPQQDSDDSDHQKNVNEAAHGVGSNQTQYPHDEQNYRNGIKHDIDLS
jgi:hypothetical protein